MPQIARGSSAGFALVIKGDVERSGRRRCEAALLDNLEEMAVQLDFLQSTKPVAASWSMKPMYPVCELQRVR